MGQSVVFNVIAANRGRQSLSNITLTVDTEVGLQHAETGSNRASRTISLLPPGQQTEIGIRFIVRKPGELKARLVAQSGDLVLAEKNAVVFGVEPTPKVSLLRVQLQSADGSKSIRPNQEVRMTGSVQNRGQTTLTNLQLLLEYEPSLALTQLSQGGSNRAQQRQVVWTLPTPLLPGKEIAIEAAFRGVEMSPQPAIRLSATTAEGINGVDTFVFNETGNVPRNEAPVMPDNGNIVPPLGNRPAPGSDRWSLTIRPIDSTTTIGSRARYVARSLKQ